MDTSIVQRAAASQERINDFLLLESEVQNYNKNRSSISGDIHFDHVTFTYNDTKIKALDDISFTIKEGSTLGIFGKTGSGKSTIANLLCRLYDTTRGKITFNKINIKDLNLFNLRSSIGLSLIHI